MLLDQAVAEATIVSAVSQTIYRLFQNLDTGAFEAAAAQFSVDGTCHRQGEALVGPDAVLAALRARPVQLLTRHLVSNLLVTIDGTEAIAGYQVLVFDHEGVERPGNLVSPRFLFSISDRLEQDHGEWRFRERRPKLIFKRN